MPERRIEDHLDHGVPISAELVSIITFAGVWATRPDGRSLVWNALAMLKSAKTLSPPGVTYMEIADIVQTGFVNPKLTKLSVLYKLGVSIHDARVYLDHRGLLLQDPTNSPLRIKSGAWRWKPSRRS